MRILLASAFAFSACASSPKPQPEVALAPHEEAEAVAAAPAPEPAPAHTKEERTGMGTIPRSELTHVLDDAPGRFLQHVEIVPRFVGGHFHGWKVVSFFPNDPRFATVDLQYGDVVTAVNGQSIEQPDQLMRVWESLRQEKLLTVSVERDGHARQLRYDIRD